jgi:hypothetical protein
LSEDFKLQNNWRGCGKEKMEDSEVLIPAEIRRRELCPGRLVSEPASFEGTPAFYCFNTVKDLVSNARVNPFGTGCGWSRAIHKCLPSVMERVAATKSWRR